MSIFRWRRGVPDGPVAPTVAYITYVGESGVGRVDCTIIEDPDLDEKGFRVFWVEPQEELPPSEDPCQVYLDVLPPRSVAKIRFPTQENPQT